MLSVGSLFAGIGGFDLGLERAGMRVAWQCEADDFCQRILAKHWPGVPCYPDVRELRGADVEPIDVLCGGFPCQDISSAGRKVGITGRRSSLWGQYARLIGELRPRYVIVENVAALLTRGLDVVLADLAALGYDAEWDCIPASAVGAPHRRDRVWVIAYPDGKSQPSEPINGSTRQRLVVSRMADSDCEQQSEKPEGADLERSRGRERPAGRRRDELPAGTGTGRGVCGGDDSEGVGGCSVGGSSADDTQVGDPDRASSDALAPSGRSRRAVSESGWWLVEPDVGRVAHGVPARVDRLRSLGNALVPQIAEWLGSQILDYESRAA